VSAAVFLLLALWSIRPCDREFAAVVYPQPSLLSTFLCPASGCGCLLLRYGIVSSRTHSVQRSTTTAITLLHRFFSQASWSLEIVCCLVCLVSRPVRVSTTLRVTQAGSNWARRYLCRIYRGLTI